MSADGLAPPPTLGADAAAQWARIVAAHHAPARIVGADLEAYCVQVVRMRDAQRRIDEEGMIVPDEKGRPVPHPALALEKQAHAEVRAWGDRFKPRR